MINYKTMRQALYIILVIVMVALTAGCTGSPKNDKGTGPGHAIQPSDTLHTKQVAMNIYGYQPIRALQIIDSAIIVGNISEPQASLCRARIYSMSLMHEQVDSLLGGPTDVRLDSAQAIGERLLRHDSVKNNLTIHRDLLEILISTARMKNDTTGWLQRSHEMVNVCRQLGAEAETDALRTEAEIGAALHSLGQHKQGMAKLDSVICLLDATFQEDGGATFDELDALIIALKRKINVLGAHDKYAETLPLAKHIIECLNDYEAHPDAYHDGSHREPNSDQARNDYIRFYRNQAQNFITAAYTSLGKHGNMFETFNVIETSAREVTAREYIARYNALQQQMEAERQQVIANKAKQTSVTIGILALLFLAFGIILFFKNRTISLKNRLLAQQIADAVKYMERYLKEKIAHEQKTDPADISTLSDEQLFQYIDNVIIREHLFTNPHFGRETIMERFSLSKERVGAVFSKGSKHAKMSTYIQQLRLEHAAQLLLEQPEKSIVQIAVEIGFTSNAYFSNRFRQQFGMSPSDYRREASERL